MNTAVAADPSYAASTDAPAVQHPPLSRLHPGVLGITVGAYATMILVFWLGFATSVDKYLPLMIFTVVLAAFVGIPWWMARSARHFWRARGVDNEPRFGSFTHFLRSPFQNGGSGGAVQGTEAVVLVALIPIALTAGLIAMAFIMHAA